MTIYILIGLIHLIVALYFDRISLPVAFMLLFAWPVIWVLMFACSISHR